MAALVERVRALQGGLPLDAAALKQRKVHAPRGKLLLMATTRHDEQHRNDIRVTSAHASSSGSLLSIDSVHTPPIKVHRS